MKGRLTKKLKTKAGFRRERGRTPQHKVREKKEKHLDR